MVIKSYVAPSVAGALKMIRSELGSKAVVLKTRGLSARESGVGHRMVEITACLEKATVGVLSDTLTDSKRRESAIGEREDVLAAFKPQKKALNAHQSGSNSIDSFIEESVEMKEQPNGGTESGMIDIRNVELFAKRLEEKLDQILDAQISVDPIKDIPTQLAPVARLLTAQDFPEKYLRPILKRIANKISGADGSKVMEIAEEAVVAEIAEHCQPNMTLGEGDLALFVGPAGCGKTSVLGKVAVDLLFKKRIKTELSTLDDFRIAAEEEITSYGEALGVNYIDANTLTSMRDGSRSRQSTSRTSSALLVDCHSNINDQRQFMRLKERSDSLNPTTVFLVISALTRSADVSRLVRRFELFNPTHIIATHTDLTDTIGGIYTAALDSGLKICALTNSPGSIGDLLSPDPAAMARRIFEGSK